MRSSAGEDSLCKEEVNEIEGNVLEMLFVFCIVYEANI